MAQAVGVSPQAVNQWVSRKKAPVDRVKTIVVATDGAVTAHDLAPEIYPKDFRFPEQPPIDPPAKPRQKVAN